MGYEDCINELIKLQKDAQEKILKHAKKRAYLYQVMMERLEMVFLVRIHPIHGIEMIERCIHGLQ